MSRIVHPSKPTVRPVVFEERLIPRLRIRHAWRDDRLIDKARRPRIDPEADKLVAFGLAPLLAILGERNGLAIGFDSARKNNRGIGFSDMRSVLLFTHVRQRDSDRKSSPRRDDERRARRGKTHERVARDE